MGKLTFKIFRTAEAVCEFANAHKVEFKHIAIKATENHHGVADITYVVFYEEKEDGETN